MQPPVRVIPGRLSVSRAFGDCCAKLTQYGGNPLVIVADPEIHTIPLSSDLDFLLIGSDGIFDNLQNSQINQIVYKEASKIPFSSFEN